MARRTPKKRTSEQDTPASHGAGRGIWSGSISFGLLQIPVTLYSAEERSEQLHFRLINKRDHAPIKNQRVSSKTGKKVEWEDVVKGFEIAKDEFVILDDEDFAKANVKATQTIDIQDFVTGASIDPAYFEMPYWLVPQKRATKAYVLLRQALEKKGAVAIATFVMRTREHLVAIMPVGEALMVEVLRFGHEVRDASKLAVPTKADAKDIKARELTMAEQLIDGMMTEWDPKKYRDRFYRDVKKIIDEKAKTGTVKEHHAQVTGTVAHDDVVDLLDLLQKSVAGAKPANEHKKPKRRAQKRSAA